MYGWASKGMWNIWVFRRVNEMLTLEKLNICEIWVCGGVEEMLVLVSCIYYVNIWKYKWCVNLGKVNIWM